MKIISPTYILTPKAILESHSIVFDKKIVDILKTEDALQKYTNLEVIETKENSLVMHGLINPHIHLEFSANKSSLKYGSFLPWLYSVIEKREDIIGSCGSDCIKKALDESLQSGTTTIGAISSYALDLGACVEAKSKVVFFNELIGSQAVMADTLYGDFIKRLDESKRYKSDTFFPAIAIHSPYSVHPILTKRAVSLAKEQDLVLSAHFMESQAEKEWLQSSSGEFKKFFKELLKSDTAVSDEMEFLELLKDKPTLLTHCAFADDKHLDVIKQSSHHIVHCPISNRLLGNSMLNLDQIEKKGIPFSLGTDGKSSNYSLDMFEEYKTALFMHKDKDLESFAQDLIINTNLNSAKALGLNTGSIELGKDSDLLLINLDFEVNSDFFTHLILHKKDIEMVFVNGK